MCKCRNLLEENPAGGFVLIFLLPKIKLFHSFSYFFRVIYKTPFFPFSQYF